MVAPEKRSGGQQTFIIHPLGIMNFSSKFHENVACSCSHDVSLWTNMLDWQKDSLHYFSPAASGDKNMWAWQKVRWINIGQCEIQQDC